jgi:MoaA/NifB/PqqE/SkfB family radical SAM enzyme
VKLKITPFAVSIEPHKGCNLQCTGCELGTNVLSRSNGSMSIYDFKKVLQQLPKTVFHINLHFQGEPLLNKSLPDMISLAVKKKFFISFSTNALLLTKERIDMILNSGLQHLIVSVDGYNQTSYEQYRKGGNFQDLQKNIQCLVQRRNELNKKYPLIELQTIVFSFNELHLDDIKKFANKIGVDALTFKTAYAIDLKQAPDYLPMNKKFLRYNSLSDGSLQIKSKTTNRCYRFYTNPVITHDLNVLPCCFDKNAVFCMGNLNNQSFLEILSGEQYSKFEKILLENKYSVKMCCNCIS